jgi:hypothetical protein
MNKNEALALAEQVAELTGLETRTANLGRDATGWAVLVDVDDRDDTRPIIVMSRYGSGYDVSYHQDAADLHEIGTLVRRFTDAARISRKAAR